MLKALLIGNLGSDAELKYSANGQPFLRCNVASNYRVRGQSGEWSDATEWVRVTLFGKRAESLAEMLKKGTRVYADGRLEARPWTDNNGNVRSGLDLMANDIELCSPRSVEDGHGRPLGAAIPSTRDDDDLPF
jgi:single-strand DNA-binding protein